MFGGARSFTLKVEEFPMKNRFRAVAAVALAVAGLAAGCAGDGKSSSMNDKPDMAMDKGMAKTCAHCGMACDANGKCPHCDAGSMNK